MAIYHLSAKVIQRSQGRSAVAAAAYRAGAALEDQRQGRTFDYTAKDGVVHSEVLLPDGAPGRWRDRAALWNEVEAIERRKDAVLAREVEFSLPRELSRAEAIALAQDFVRAQFVARGMVADLNVHWTRSKERGGEDGEAKPHAHVMLSMREVDTAAGGFGKKRRDWNDVALLRDWREAWADLANARLLELGHDTRIDHRSLRDQGIDLEPQHKVGPAGARREQRGEDAERAAEHRAIAQRNGEALLAEPAIALTALTRQQSTFSRQDIARFVDRHSDGAGQFTAVMAKVEAAPTLVRLGQDGRGRARFTTREMLDVERRMEDAAAAIAERDRHGISMASARVAKAVADRAGMRLGTEQDAALEHVTNGHADLALVVGYAGTGKSAMLGLARAAWRAEGYAVRGAALSGIAAEGLEAGSGISSRTLASLEHAWAAGREALGPRDVLVVDEAGLVGSRQMERVLGHARAAGAKVVLVGDPEQLQAIEAGAAFRALAERHGAVEISEVRRQRPAWQREATKELATARTADALGRYAAAGMVQVAETREAAREALVAGWDAIRRKGADASQVILAYTRDDVRALNTLARARMRAGGALRGPDCAVAAERGERLFAIGERLMFERNERALGAGFGLPGVAVKNGTLGTVLEVADGGQRLTVRLDGPGGSAAASKAGQEGRDGQGDGNGGGRVVTFSTRDYAHVEHGYAATIHKAQGVTVDRAHVLASGHMDRHAAYVGLTRHRDGVALHYGRDEFADAAALARTLGRQRAKDTSLDYGVEAERDADRDGGELAWRYAERRGLATESQIVVRPEPARRTDERTAPKRGKFSGLRLDARPAVPAGPMRAPERATPASTPPAREPAGRERHEPLDGPLDGLLAGYARAWSDAERMRRAGLPVLAHQEAALAAAAHPLERHEAGLAGDARAALEGEPGLARAVAGPDVDQPGIRQSGAAALRRAVGDTRDRRLELDRAGRRVIEVWDAVEAEYEAAGKAREWSAQRAVGTRLKAVAERIKEAPWLNDLLRDRGRELGVIERSRLDQLLRAPEVDWRLLRTMDVDHGPKSRPGPSLER